MCVKKKIYKITRNTVIRNTVGGYQKKKTIGIKKKT